MCDDFSHNCNVYFICQNIQWWAQSTAVLLLGTFEFYQFNSNKKTIFEIFFYFYF